MTTFAAPSAGSPPALDDPDLPGPVPHSVVKFHAPELVVLTGAEKVLLNFGTP